MMTTMPTIIGKGYTKKPTKPFDKNATSYQGKDNREGRLTTIKTDRGEFRFKDDRNGDSSK